MIMASHEAARKDWDTYFMDIAYMASTRSRCPRRHVGAVLVQGKNLMGTAYNGAPSGAPDCSEEGCMIVEEYELQHKDGQEQMIKSSAASVRSTPSRTCCFSRTAFTVKARPCM